MPAVLIAVADSDLCDLYQHFFAHHGWQVLSCGRGLGCLAQLRQRLPRLLILDVQLPSGGADGVLAVLRADADLGCIPVILTTTEASHEVSSCRVGPPIVHVLRKPFSLTTLLDLMSFTLQKGWPESWKECRATVCTA
jgi:DNA-binding response OmpR family regulator